MKVLLLSEEEIRNLVTLPEAIQEMENAFRAYSEKHASLPGVIHLDVPEHQGEVHIKTGYIHGATEFVVKIASGFAENKGKGLPFGSGMMMVSDSETGFPAAVLLDNGYLTELRTAAAGAVAAKYLASNSVEQAGVLGAGMQGRFQVRALACVRKISRVKVYDHRSSNIERYVDEMSREMDIEFVPAFKPEDAVRGSTVVITATPSRSPIVQADWVGPGTHITAMGSDGAEKQELDVSVLQRADRIVADSLPQCVRLGEIHHAIAAQVLREKDIAGELGDVIAGKISGRENDSEITVCDLTGVGVQDAAIAGLVFRRARSENIGSLYP